MMHRCGSSQGNIGGPCSCGLFHSQTNPFSMFFSMPNHKPFDEANDNMYRYTSSPSSVDCTLSLGTPSTRITENEEKRIRTDRLSGSCVSNFCWDLLHPRHGSPPQKNSRSGNNGGGGGATNGCIDPLLARRCANCDTTSTPLWRNGPRGPKSLCNACGIRFKKEERRASAAPATTSNGASSGLVMGGSWLQNHSQTQKPSPCFSPAISNEYMFIEDESRREPDNSISFLSWRLNVTDRPSLVHNFTR